MVGDRPDASTHSSRTARAHFRLLALLVAWTCACPPSNAEMLISDDFDGTGRVNTRIWRMPDPGVVLGRTELKGTDAGYTHLPVLSGNGTALLELDTYNPSAPGATFWGAEMFTKRTFAVGGGLRYDVRMRVRNAAGGDPPAGLVGAVFAFDTTRARNGELVRDEIDDETLTNQLDAMLSNVWDDLGGSTAGDPILHTPSHPMPVPPDFRITDFHTYRVDWLPDRVQWYIDGNLVRTDTMPLPTDPMTLRSNIWAPDANFAAAFDAGLQPASNEAANATYQVEVDSVTVTRLNTEVGPNLLVDASFEDRALPAPDGTGGWSRFGEAHLEENRGANGGHVPARSGDTVMKTFGLFTGQPNASGAFQNVPAQPGQQFEGRVYVETSTLIHGSGDSIAGQGNAGVVDIEFLDAAGNILVDPVTDDSGNVVVEFERNSNSTLVLDGRDPQLPQDEWVLGVVNARAPEGTAYARLVTAFLQQSTGPGSVLFDDAFLGQLTAALPGDLDGDRDVDFDDIDGLVLGLNNRTRYREQFGVPADVRGDTDHDGDIDFDDVPGFVALLTSGSVRAIPEPSTFALALASLTGIGFVFLRNIENARRTRRIRILLCAPWSGQFPRRPKRRPPPHAVEPSAAGAEGPVAQRARVAQRRVEQTPEVAERFAPMLG